MANKRQLFDKPMDALHEAFIRARFAQQDVFGCAEIETWLKLQRTVERPDEPVWMVFLCRDFLAMCAATAPIVHLRERATTQHVQPGDHTYWKIYFQFHGGLYLGHHGTGIYAPAGQQAMFALNETHGTLTVERIYDTNIPFGARAVVNVLFAEWLYGRPRWSEAREFLCDALAEEIKRERAKAEHDFDTAVAVSADGTKICHAEVVVVFGTNDDASEDVWFPGEAFRASKALRVLDRCSPHCQDDTWSTYSTVAKFFAHAASTNSTGNAYRDATAHTRYKHEQHLVRCDDEKILFVHRDQCPSPLPDDGVEVTV